MCVAAEAGRGPGMNDKPVYAACQLCADVNMFIKTLALPGCSPATPIRSVKE
jgi:hypothetical protein